VLSVLYFHRAVGVRRYRVRWTDHPGDGGYISRNRDFSSLRAAAEHVRDLPETSEFQEIRALEIESLTPQEKAAFALFTDGKIVLT